MVVIAVVAHISELIEVMELMFSLKTTMFHNFDKFK